MGSLWRWWVTFRVCVHVVSMIYSYHAVIGWMHLSSFEKPYRSNGLVLAALMTYAERLHFVLFFYLVFFKFCIFIFVVCLILFKGCEVMPKVLNVYRKVSELQNSIFMPFIVLVWKIFLWYCHRVFLYSPCRLFSMQSVLSKLKNRLVFPQNFILTGRGRSVGPVFSI